jgi:hypothetical protein
VAENEMLRRIDQHLARSNERMARGNELSDANRRAFEDLRVFLRDMTGRQERVMNALVEQVGRQTEQIGRQTEQIGRQNR